MTPIQAVGLGVRLFVIWCALYFGRAAPAYYLQARRFDDAAASVIAALMALVVVAVLAWLWFFPRTVARSLLPPGDSLALGALPEDRWLAVGCSLLGLWVLTDTLPGLLRQLYLLYHAQRTQVTLQDAPAALVYYLAELAVGAWLLLGARGVQTLWRRVRSRAADA